MSMQDWVSIVGGISGCNCFRTHSSLLWVLVLPYWYCFRFGSLTGRNLGYGYSHLIQVETIVLAGSMGKNFRERISIVMLCGLLMTVLGVLGLLGAIVII